MTDSILFQRRDVEQYTDSLANYLPGGPLFAAKSVKDSNFRRLLRGMAGELFRANGLLKQYSEDFIPDRTVAFIEEWERALGIPDGCFDGQGTLDKRRRDVLVKLASLGVQTAQDFVDLAAVFDVVVEVYPGKDKFDDLSALGMTLHDARFTIVVDFAVRAAFQFPYTFPIRFGDERIAIMECLFNRLIPANCQIMFRRKAAEPKGNFAYFGFPGGYGFGDFADPGQGGIFIGESVGDTRYEFDDSSYATLGQPWQPNSARWSIEVEAQSSDGAAHNHSQGIVGGNTVWIYTNIQSIGDSSAARVIDSSGTSRFMSFGNSAILGRKLLRLEVFADKAQTYVDDVLTSTGNFTFSDPSQNTVDVIGSGAGGTNTNEGAIKNVKLTDHSPIQGGHFMVAAGDPTNRYCKLREMIVLSGDFRIEMWVLNKGVLRVFGKEDNFEDRLYIGATGEVIFTFSGESISAPAGTVTTDQHHKITIERVGSTGNLYVDDVLVATDSAPIEDFDFDVVYTQNAIYSSTGGILANFHVEDLSTGDEWFYSNKGLTGTRLVDSGPKRNHGTWIGGDDVDRMLMPVNNRFYPMVDYGDSSFTDVIGDISANIQNYSSLNWSQD